ncbi:MAG TPA: hypothetical protein VJR49_02380 [Chthoniobacterales bacterium]|nr:hypothetical protein [Chthoniobacterales bacterium]
MRLLENAPDKGTSLNSSHIVLNARLSFAALGLHSFVQNMFPRRLLDQPSAIHMLAQKAKFYG